MDIFLTVSLVGQCSYTKSRVISVNTASDFQIVFSEAISMDTSLYNRTQSKPERPKGQINIHKLACKPG